MRKRDINDPRAFLGRLFGGLGRASGGPGSIGEGPGMPEEVQKYSKIALGCLFGGSRALRGISEVENRDFVKNATTLKQKAVFWGSPLTPNWLKSKII